MGIRLEPLDDRDFDTIARWNEGKSKDFLVQWSGPLYEHPLTAAHLREVHAGHNEPGSDTHIYRVMLGGEMIGTVMLLKFDEAEKSAVIGRFLIGDETLRGRGIGKQALREISRIAFEQFRLDAVKLAVFDFNQNAIRCYEQVGFETYEFQPDAWRAADGPWGLFRMKLTKSRFQDAEGR